MRDRQRNYGRICFGLGIAGIGLQHFFYAGFRPLLAPIPAEATAPISGLIYLIAAYLLLSGVFIAIGKKVAILSTILGWVFVLFLVLGHLPNRLSNHPELLGAWTDAIKLFALSGGSMMFSLAFSEKANFRYLDKWARIAPVGKYFFAIMLILFGIAHLISPVEISKIVPQYIPFALFWTYFSGVALIGAGVAIIVNYQVKYVANLLSLMLCIWLFSLHIYYAVRFPEFRDGENIIGSYTCLAFLGIALLLAGGYDKWAKQPE
jgi:uncharacterized membrane protein